MKKFILNFAVTAFIPLLCSCGLTYETLSMQMMRPSASTIDLRNRTMSAFMVYRTSQDSTICCQMMTAFVEKMAEEYSRDVALFAMPYDEKAVYSERDTLAGLVTMANTDVVFLMLPTGRTDAVTSAYECTLLLYDSLLKDDKVFSMSGINVSAINAGFTANNLIANFGPSWKSANFKVLYYDGNREWTDALEYSISGNWTAAVDAWMELLSKSSVLERRSAAEYNIAVGCYLQGDIPLAEKWLKQAATDCKSAVIPSYIDYLQALISKETE